MKVADLMSTKLFTVSPDDSVEGAVAELEVRTLLSGEYDAREAFVTIRSGAGGVDAADWAEMLLRMYTRYCERHGWPIEVYDTSYAEEAGIDHNADAVNRQAGFCNRCGQHHLSCAGLGRRNRGHSARARQRAAQGSWQRSIAHGHRVLQR